LLIILSFLDLAYRVYKKGRQIEEHATKKLDAKSNL